MSAITQGFDGSPRPHYIIPTFNPTPTTYLDELGYIYDLFNSQEANAAYIPSIARSMMTRRGLRVLERTIDVAYHGTRDDYTELLQEELIAYAEQHGYMYAAGLRSDTGMIFVGSEIRAVVMLWNGASADGEARLFINAEYNIGKEIADWLMRDSVGRRPNMLRYYMTAHGIAESTVTFNEPDMTIPSELLWPYLEYTPEVMIEKFLASTANVLVLLGAPGTGKTSYVKRMLAHGVFPQKRKASVIDSPAVMRDDGLITKIHMMPKGSLVLFEDVDEYLRPRTDGNDQMSSLLNAAEGIASPDVKFVITTNLKNISMMDDAIHRPGRCYDKLTFSKLDFAQQQALAEFAGVNTHNDGATLAEVMSTHTHSSKPLEQGFRL